MLNLLAIVIATERTSGATAPEAPRRTLLATKGALDHETLCKTQETAEGTVVTSLTSASQGRFFNPKLSPDGSTVAVSRRLTTPSGESWQVVTFRLDAPSRMAVVAGGVRVHAEDPSWSCDGTSLVYKETGSARCPNGGIVRIGLRDGRTELLSSAAAFAGKPCSVPSFSRHDHGARVAFQCDLDGSGNDQIFVVDCRTKAARQLTHEATKHWYPAWNPLDDSLVYVKHDLSTGPETPPSKLWRIDVGRGTERPVAVPARLGIAERTDLVDPAFSPKGRLAFSARWDVRDGGVYKMFELDPSLMALSGIVTQETVGLYGAEYVSEPR